MVFHQPKMSIIPKKGGPNKKQGPPFDDPDTSFDNLVNEMVQRYKLFLIHQTSCKNRAKINCRHLNVTAVLSFNGMSS